MSYPSEKQHYQLTCHPTGSWRELFSLIGPLFMAFVSSNLMIFVDRLLLAHYDPLALNGCVNAGIVYFAFLVFPLAISATSEVVVGRLRGENRLEETGLVAWQMIWASLMAAPLFWILAYLLPPLLFYGTGNTDYEIAYFTPLLACASVVCANVTLAGFFTATGRTSVVTCCTLIANLANIALAYTFIFGNFLIPPLGITGAAIATVSAQIIQLLCLLFFFLFGSHRDSHGVWNIQYNFHYLLTSLKMGVPAGIGHTVEMVGHCLFFRLIMLSGPDHFSIVAAVQAIFILLSTLIEAETKAISAIISNLLGANQFSLTASAFKTAIRCHLLIALSMGLILWSSAGYVFALFFGSSLDPVFIPITQNALLWMCCFFAFDGFNWILIGCFTAAGDTRFLMRTSLLMNSLGYSIPSFLILSGSWKGADTAWLILALYGVCNFIIYRRRYLSGRWLLAVRPIADATTHLDSELEMG